MDTKRHTYNQARTLSFAPSGIPDHRVSDIPEFTETHVSWPTIKRLLPIIRALSELHSDFATVKSNIIRLCNTGHTFSLVCPTKDDLRMAEESLNEFTVDVRARTGGINGVINQLLSQLATDGAVSAEAEAEFETLPGFDGPFPTRIAGIHQVDVRSLELQYSKKYFGYLPFQKQKGVRDPVMLPDKMYHLQVFKPLPDPNPPYPVPPMIAGLSEARRQKNMLHSIDRAMEKIGLLGIMDATIETPEQGENEEDTDYTTRLRSILSSVVTMLGKSLSQGIYAHYGQLDFKFTNFGAEFSKTLPLLEHERQRMAQSLQNDWASTREQSTFLSIVYEKILNEMVHYQHLVTGPIEQWTRLHLALQGLVRGFTVLTTSLSLDQDSVRYWENELVKGEVAKNLVELGVDPSEALRYINVNVGMGADNQHEPDNGGTQEKVKDAVMSSLRPYSTIYNRLHQGIFRFSLHNKHGRHYTLEKIHNFAISDV